MSSHALQLAMSFICSSQEPNWRACYETRIWSNNLVGNWLLDFLAVLTVFLQLQFFLYFNCCSLTGADSVFPTGYKSIVRRWFMKMGPLLKTILKLFTNWEVTLRKSFNVTASFNVSPLSIKSIQLVNISTVKARLWEPKILQVSLGPWTMNTIDWFVR